DGKDLGVAHTVEELRRLMENPL
ncbi:hypothetical protein LCGC14_2607360, partial [marine sediment metagenome]